MQGQLNARHIAWREGSGFGVLAEIPIPNRAGAIRTMVIAPWSPGIRQCPVPRSRFVLLKPFAT